MEAKDIQKKLIDITSPEDSDFSFPDAQSYSNLPAPEDAISDPPRVHLNYQKMQTQGGTTVVNQWRDSFLFGELKDWEKKDLESLPLLGFETINNRGHTAWVFEDKDRAKQERFERLPPQGRREFLLQLTQEAGIRLRQLAFFQKSQSFWKDPERQLRQMSAQDLLKVVTERNQVKGLMDTAGPAIRNTDPDACSGSTEICFKAFGDADRAVESIVPELKYILQANSQYLKSIENAPENFVALVNSVPLEKKTPILQILAGDSHEAVRNHVMSHTVVASDQQSETPYVPPLGGYADYYEVDPLDSELPPTNIPPAEAMPSTSQPPPDVVTKVSAETMVDLALYFYDYGTRWTPEMKQIFRLRNQDGSLDDKFFNIAEAHLNTSGYYERRQDYITRMHLPRDPAKGGAVAEKYMLQSLLPFVPPHMAEILREIQARRDKKRAESPSPK